MSQRLSCLSFIKASHPKAIFCRGVSLYQIVTSGNWVSYREAKPCFHVPRAQPLSSLPYTLSATPSGILPLVYLGSPHLPPAPMTPVVLGCRQGFVLRSSTKCGHALLFAFSFSSVQQKNPHSNFLVCTTILTQG